MHSNEFLDIDVENLTYSLSHSKKIETLRNFLVDLSKNDLMKCHGGM